MFLIKSVKMILTEFPAKRSLTELPNEILAKILFFLGPRCKDNLGNGEDAIHLLQTCKTLFALRDLKEIRLPPLELNIPRGFTWEYGKRFFATGDLLIPGGIAGYRRIIMTGKTVENRSDGGKVIRIIIDEFPGLNHESYNCWGTTVIWDSYDKKLFIKPKAEPVILPVQILPVPRQRPARGRQPAQLRFYQEWLRTQPAGSLKKENKEATAQRWQEYKRTPAYYNRER